MIGLFEKEIGMGHLGAVRGEEINQNLFLIPMVQHLEIIQLHLKTGLREINDPEIQSTKIVRAGIIIIV